MSLLTQFIRTYAILFLVSYLTIFTNDIHGVCRYVPDIYFAEPVEPTREHFFEEGTTLQFKCKKGFDPVPNVNNVLTCLGRTWTPHKTFCTPVNCPNPNVKNSRRLSGFTGPYTLNSAISFECDKDFVLRGSGLISCNIDSQWIPAIPLCEWRGRESKQVLCAAPESPANGEYHPQKEEYTYLDSVTFSCQKPFQVVGDASISCTGTGEWSSNSPTCKAVNCPNPNVTNSRRLSGFIGPYTLNSAISFECDKDFVLRGSGLISCNIDSQWIPAIPLCERSESKQVLCAAPESPANGEYHPQKDEYTYLDSVTFSCQEPLEVAGDASISCTGTGEWSSNSPTCKAVNCPNPNVTNSRRLSGFIGPYTLNSAISFECDKDFVLRGSGSISCNIDSQWIPAIPLCERSESKPVNCPNPEVKNSRRLSGSFGPHTLNSVISFKCDDDFFLRGSSSITCNSDSEWVPAVPVCERKSVNCPDPHVKNSRRLSGFTGPYTLNSVILFECDEGFHLEGSSSITCNSYSEWEPAIPYCEDNTPVWKIVVIVLGVIGALAIIGFVVYKFVYKKQNRGDYHCSVKTDKFAASVEPEL
ncbi:complement receptor type 2-like isoform X3 [Lithobates pipiens]